MTITIPTLATGTLLVNEIEIKRSRFIATIARTDSPEEAHDIIHTVKADHPQARHNCSAYIIQVNGRNPHQHSSDDGEPSGTAGTPMLEAIKGAGLWNVTAVVTRYFGGILLGTGGLVRAYSTAVSQALVQAPKAQLRELTVLETTLSHIQAGKIEAELRHDGIHILNAQWDNNVTLTIASPETNITTLNEKLATLTAGQASAHIVGKTMIEIATNPHQALR